MYFLYFPLILYFFYVTILVGYFKQVETPSIEDLLRKVK